MDNLELMKISTWVNVGVIACSLLFCGGLRASLADAVISDFPRLAGETDDAIASAANGVLAVPRGDYAIATPLVVTNRCSIEMHPAARLVAAAKMDFVLTWDGCGDYHSLTVFDGEGKVYDNLGLFIRSRFGSQRRI